MTVILIAIQPKKVLVWKKSMEKFGSKEITSATIKYNNILRITGRQFNDFVVCAFSNDGTPMFFMERIFPDINNWEITVLKIT